jgi:hypothetical protein
MNTLFATGATALLVLGWLALSGAPPVAAQASAVCDGAEAGCVVSSSAQLSLASGQTISRVLACPEGTPALVGSTYTSSNPSVIVTQAPSDDGQAANFTALNRSNALTFVTFHAGCGP